jgi:phosphoribosyl 1,2-cyclic phosphodiesterase
MKVCVLGSGSKGNAAYVEAGETRVIFDAGFSAREIKNRMDAAGLDAGSLQAVFISHEHVDHVRGLPVMGRRLPVYATAGTRKGIEKNFGFEISAHETIRAGEAVKFGDLKILPIPVSHDALEPVGFAIDDGLHRLAIVTDLGVATHALVHRLTDLSLLLIEANHDLDMLMNGPYPWDLKQRVKGRLGHLANHDTAELVTTVLSPSLKHLLLAHLSEQNNTPALALKAVRRSVDGSGVRLEACSQGRSTGLISV